MNSGQPVVSIRDLYMAYGSKIVLRSISLDVYPGQIIGYIGPNGAGKSTTVKIMLGLVTGYLGDIHLFGQPITNEDVQYRNRIGYVPEVVDMYDNLTASEYLTFIGELYGMTWDQANRKALLLMERLGLPHNVYHKPISTYSKGMKQKVMLISSLLHNPDLLFLDEPLSGLDANSVMIVKEILAQLAAQGKTIFYSSHMMDVVEKISDRIVLIHDGRIVADGTFDELKEHNHEGTLEEIFNDLTGFHDHKAIAIDFVSIVQEVKE